MQLIRRSIRTSRAAVGFTIVEILVVVGVIVVLAGILLTAMTVLKDTGQMAQTMSRMKQIGIFMNIYSTDNRDTIVPSQFDYSSSPNPGLVRSINPIEGDVNKGTWADILWTTNKLGPVSHVEPELGTDYRYDSPDKAFYEYLDNYDNNPFRAPATNSREVVGGTGALPYGTGATESGLPGFFAANDFFDMRPLNPGQKQRWFSNGQVRAPDRSLYLVDSYAGEVIDNDEESWSGEDGPDGDNLPDGDVDFRYAGSCVMLFLDGHAGPEGPWSELSELEGDPAQPEIRSRGYKISDPTTR